MLKEPGIAAQAPRLAEVEANRAALGKLIHETPVFRCSSAIRSDEGQETWLKLEAFQMTGSFKARGALSVVRHLTPEQRARGLTTVSSGNHAIALSYAARVFGCQAHVFMSHRADEYRVAQARALGATVTLTEDVRAAFEQARAQVAQNHMTFVHPFDGPYTTLGTASIALELHAQLPRSVDTFVVAIGGGSLASGLAPTIKALRPNARVIGVEPVGAPTLTRSIAAGKPMAVEDTNTIADSLAPPFAEPYSFAIVRDYVDEILLIEDENILRGMRLLFRHLKLAVEPAAATALAGVLAHPERFSGRNVCAMVCGSNIGLRRYSELVGEGL